MTAHKDLRLNNAYKKRAIRIEQNKPDYQKAPKEEKRGRIASILQNFQFRLRRAS